MRDASQKTYWDNYLRRNNWILLLKSSARINILSPNYEWNKQLTPQHLQLTCSKSKLARWTNNFRPWHRNLWHPCTKQCLHLSGIARMSKLRGNSMRTVQSMCNMHLLGDLRAHSRHEIRHPEITSEGILSHTLSVLPVCSLHVHMKIVIPYVKKWSLTLASTLFHPGTNKFYVGTGSGMPRYGYTTAAPCVLTWTICGASSSCYYHSWCVSSLRRFLSEEWVPPAVQGSIDYSSRHYMPAHNYFGDK